MELPSSSSSTRRPLRVGLTESCLLVCVRVCVVLLSQRLLLHSPPLRPTLRVLSGRPASMCVRGTRGELISPLCFFLFFLPYCGGQGFGCADVWLRAGARLCSHTQRRPSTCVFTAMGHLALCARARARLVIRPNCCGGFFSFLLLGFLLVQCAVRLAAAAAPVWGFQARRISEWRRGLSLPSLRPSAARCPPRSSMTFSFS